MLIAFSVLLLLFVAVFAFLQRPEFGKLPSGKRLERIKQSPNYRDGSFQNINHTPDLTEGVTYYAVMKEFLFSEKKRNKPVDTIPSKKTDLFKLDPSENVLVWFGHSSYFIQLDGKKILVDPVLSGSASPLAFTTRSFPGTDVYTPTEIPDIDYLFISHDHWDHLDYKTLKELQPRIGKVICGLGTGEHLEYWGFDVNKIIEKDWNEEIPLEDGFVAFTAPARHFSGRGFSRNKSLWTSFILRSPSKQIYIGGDSGYDTHFREIGEKFGRIDLAIIENGQYDKSWRYIHLLPDEFIQAAADLNAQTIFPVHSSKFALGNHAWDDPLKTVMQLNEKTQRRFITPMIGEQVNLNDSTQTFSRWWDGLE